MIAVVGISAFFLVGLVVAGRLLGVWRRTRQLPELAAALGLLFLGPLGFCIVMTGTVILAGTPWQNLLRGAGLMIQALGFVSVTAFTWRVFRPHERWAVGLASAFGFGLLASGIATALEPFQPGSPTLSFHLANLLKITCMAWGAVEAVLYWRISQKRVALGFADPLVSASFLMWGVVLATSGLGFVLIYVALLSLSPGEYLSTLVQTLLSACGIVAATALYASFLPPSFYIRWVETQAPGEVG